MNPLEQAEQAERRTNDAIDNAQTLLIDLQQYIQDAYFSGSQPNLEAYQARMLYITNTIRTLSRIDKRKFNR